MFCIGQYVMYSYSGICRVEAIGTLSFTNDSQKEYYTLRPSYTTTNEKIYVSVNTSAFMREVITREEAFLYLEYLKLKLRTYKNGFKSYNTRHFCILCTRKNAIMHTLIAALRMLGWNS